MRDFRLEITEQDVKKAASLTGYSTSNFQQHTPACAAMERLTGSKWHTAAAMVLAEDRPPYRTCLLPSRLRDELQKFMQTGEMKPDCFTIEMDWGKGHCPPQMEEPRDFS